MNTALNYKGLTLSITKGIDSDVVVQALLSLGYKKPGPKSRWTLADLQDMREMLRDSTYNEVAEHYGLKRGDNVYQCLFRLPCFRGYEEPNKGIRRCPMR